MGNAEWSFITAAGNTYSAEEISALILRRLREDAEAFTGDQLDHAVISVPAYFQEPERQATIDAAALAGLKVPRIINEPTAAALAFAVDSDVQGEVVVYDLGGGTFDVTVLNVQPDELRVRASGGDRNLGGFEWDNALIEHVKRCVEELTGAALAADAATEQDLRDKVETAKVALSSMSSARIVLAIEGKPEVLTVTRAEFEEITEFLLERTRVILDEVVEEAELAWPDVQRVLLVGGSTKMPAVARMLEEVSGKAPSREVHPDEAVALGAAIQAGVIARELEPAPPAGGSGAEETTFEEVPELIDVTAHSLGVVLMDSATQEPYNDITIERNTELPCSVSKIYRTLTDGQNIWSVRVTQGEERDLRYVKIVGTGEIRHEAKPMNHPMRVDWQYDKDGIVNVSVYDGVAGTFLGGTKLRRESSLSPEELAEKQRRIGDMTLE
jgi:molecular chaperone DnaK